MGASLLNTSGIGSGRGHWKWDKTDERRIGHIVVIYHFYAFKPSKIYK